MVDLEISKEVFTSFAGTLLAIFSAGVVWFIRSAYEKHKAEKSALAKFERIFALNLTMLSDNFYFIDEWSVALRNDRPYSFQLREFIIDEEATYKTSNLRLINKILSVNHMLNSLNLDLKNMYKSYWEVISRIDSDKDEQQKIRDLKAFHDTIQGHLTRVKQNYNPFKNHIL